MSTLVATRYGPKGASSRLRFHDLVTGFAESPQLVLFDELWGDNYVSRIGQASKPRKVLSSAFGIVARIARLLGTSRPAIDTLIIQQELLPYVPYWIERAILRRLQAGRVVVDLDDAIFETYRLHRSPIVRRLLGRKLQRLWKLADIVVAGSPYLSEAVRMEVGEGTKVVAIPTVLDVWRYEPKDSYMSARTLRIGWIGSPSTARHLNLVAPAVLSLSKSLSVELVVVGGRAPDCLSHLSIEIPWSLGSEVQIAQSLDIGIMPLSDTPFERGKCGYKLLQYMAAGVPVVASDVGVNSEIVCGKNACAGTIVESDEQWLAALEALAFDSDLRSLYGRTGRRIVVEHYSKERAIEDWNRTLSLPGVAVDFSTLTGPRNRMDLREDHG